MLKLVEKGFEPQVAEECSFMKIETAIIQTKNLTETEKLFYMTLKSFRNRKSKLCFPSIKRVCERSGYHQNTAYKCRKKLVELGIIDYTSERGRTKSCNYRFILEDGNSQEISRALANLSQNKIPSLKGNKIPSLKGNKIPSLKGSPLYITRRSITTTKKQPKNGGGVCEIPTDKKPKTIPDDVKNYIELKVADTESKNMIRTTKIAYQKSLEIKYFTGTLDLTDFEELKRNNGGWKNPPNIQQDEKDQDPVPYSEVVKQDAAHRLTMMLFDLNVERNPTFKRPRKIEPQFFKKLLQEHTENEVEAVLRTCHKQGFNSSLWDPYIFMKDFAELSEKAQTL